MVPPCTTPVGLFVLGLLVTKVLLNFKGGFSLEYFTLSPAPSLSLPHPQPAMASSSPGVSYQGGHPANTAHMVGGRVCFLPGPLSVCACGHFRLHGILNMLYA